MSTTMDVLGHFSGAHGLKNIDEKLETILNSDPNLTELSKELEQKSKEISQVIENSK
eukprot:CAMPEP_0205814520 /NCGR_PEP_ID=MMETSP0205-20121125/19725_1 /ASSEMBLY_ACC=CAM_ASM_000278 /TAXON_ID=36767 /ORGANISM="Euplotes focardii, Strain TN1" /LENGTH=56 /DNA_ID=CAMNT_0053098783 /DNA_START=298 /DNA_END=465 /DNA_ORIENTATION=-